jgi:hypothetical protein
VATRLAPAAPWLAFVLATQRWPSWDEGIRRAYATDVTSYEAIARAAPELPSTDLPLQHAERFAPHWAVGSLARASGVPLHDLYRVATYAVLLALVFVVDATLTAEGVDGRRRSLALGVLVASTYPVHYLLAAPGMLADAVFLLGFATVLYGLARGSLGLVLLGLLLGTVGRQTAVPLAPFVAAAVASAPGARARWLRAGACIAVPVGAYAVLHEVAARFAQPDNAPFSTITVLGSLDHPHALAEHAGRTLLGVLVPLALIVAVAMRGGVRLPRWPLLLAAVVLAETLALGPDWAAHSEPRLAALALPALAVAAGTLLRQVPLDGVRTAAIALAVAAASLHHLYTRLPTDRAVAWFALSACGAAAVFAALARRRADEPL